MVLKASINGPNRRRNRIGDRTVASTFDDGSTKKSNERSGDENTNNKTTTTISFRLRSLEKFLDDNDNENDDDNSSNREMMNIPAYGNACLFTVGNGNGMGRALLERHFQTIGGGSPICNDDDTDANSLTAAISFHDPVLLYFHDLPIFVVRAIPIPTTNTATTNGCVGGDEMPYNVNKHRNAEDIIYVTQAHCHNHKICEDTVYTVTCCSRPSTSTELNAAESSPPSSVVSSNSSDSLIQDYDQLAAVGIDVHRRYSTTIDTNTHDDDHHHPDDTNNNNNNNNNLTLDANHIAKELMNHTDRSILTLNECILLSISNTELICRVSKVRLPYLADNEMLGSTDDEPPPPLTSIEASMEEPYRGRVTIHTEFYIAPSHNFNASDLLIEGARTLGDGEFPEDVVHVTTSDMEWFPVRRVILVSCLKLTKYVQAGRGKYRSNANDNSSTTKEEKQGLPLLLTTNEEERSPDAPTNDDRPHCKLPIDCCTFDRVLLFLMSTLFPQEYKFALDLSEINCLKHAADVLGLQPLVDLCTDQASAFESRVRKDSYISLNEVKRRNANGCGGDGGEMLIILDGMVLDITRWIDEHPGGPSIIPTQALNIDSTVFFEMYHVSRQAFLYLKSFYIGELSPEDAALLLRNRLDGACATEGFLQSLRSYTKQWRVSTIEENAGKTVHNSL